METVTVCPLGCECEEAKDGKLYRCEWFIEVVGKNPQTGDDIHEQKCALAWMPMMQVEQARQVRSVAAALESHRNVVKSTGDAMIQMEKERSLKAVGE